jgi:dsRNA-specific ribonuclease
VITFPPVVHIELIQPQCCVIALTNNEFLKVIARRLKVPVRGAYTGKAAANAMEAGIGIVCLVFGWDTARVWLAPLIKPIVKEIYR